MSWLKFGWEVVKMRALRLAAVAILAGGLQRQLVGTAQLVLQPDEPIAGCDQCFFLQLMIRLV